MYDTEFTNNEAVSGGAIGNLPIAEGDTESASLTLERINLTSNKAKNGGAIVNIGTFSLTSCCLAENKAEISGGAVFNKGNIISINFNNFTTNQATNGGALYNEGGGIYVGNENIFNKNKAKIGGAINNQAGSIK